MPVAAGVPHPHRCDGIYWRLLDPAAANAGSCGHGGPSRECTIRQECPGPEDGCSRLSMDSISTFSWTVEGLIPSAQEVCAIRSVLRHRDNLVGLASQHVLHMQKALDQMNLQLHHVI